MGEGEEGGKGKRARKSMAIEMEGETMTEVDEMKGNREVGVEREADEVEAENVESMADVLD